MSSLIMSPGQKAVEERYDKIKKIPVNPDKSASEQFGDMELWIFTLGEYRLFLNPLNKGWYFFDRAHNDWKDIKAPVGSVIFRLNGPELEIIKAGNVSGQQASPGPVHTPHQWFCPQCGTAVQPDKKFCPQCGTKMI